MVKLYLIGFGLVFIGFIVGFFAASLLVVGRRADETIKAIQAWRCRSCGMMPNLTDDGLCCECDEAVRAMERGHE